jgi:lysophospholipase L1-like esterase
MGILRSKLFEFRVFTCFKQLKHTDNSLFIGHFILIILLATTSIAQAQQSIKPLNIVCIGNSITFGATAPHPESQSYPAVLQQLLKENRYLNYRVKNFGLGSATMIHYGKPNVWQMLDSVKKNVPDIILIKAGTNETIGKPRYNWEHVAEFEKDYNEFLAEIRKINPNCKIILCSPLDVSLKVKGLSPERLETLVLIKPRIWKIRKHVQSVAKANRTFFLDLTQAFKGKTAFITEGDGIHPNVGGYHYLAERVFSFLLKKKLLTNDKI